MIITALDNEEKPPQPEGCGVKSIHRTRRTKLPPATRWKKNLRKIYGCSSEMIRKIYDSNNKSLIGPDVNVVKVGWVLHLPQPLRLPVPIA